MKTICTKGLHIPILGQGGWELGDNPQKTEKEIAALRHGLSLGLNLIDTAEMYGNGSSEELIAQALKGIARHEYLLVSKVFPHNAGKNHIFTSCDQSLKRLETDYLDIYLLHWRGTIPLEETVWCMEQLVKSGKIKHWGVSNFDVCDMEDLWSTPNGSNCAVNQVLYHLGSRGIEFDLLPWAKDHNIPIMAYCPLAQGGQLKRMHKDFLSDPLLLSIAKRYNITVMQLLLAFVLRQPNVCAIPKASSIAHVTQNAAVVALSISSDDWALIDNVFWPPTAKMHLDIE